MRSRPLALAVALALAATPAAAQPKPDAAATAEAKSHFDKGLKLYKEGALREALAEFIQANKLVPRASVLRNIAQCHRDLKNFAAAHSAYAELLKLYGGAMKAAESKQLKAALADLAVLTGVVSVTSTEADARVEIDGKEVGATPIGPVRLNVGAHQIAISKPGFNPMARQVELQGKDEVAAAFEMKKEVTTGHLAVTARGGDATTRLKVDGAEVGALPWEGDVAPGSHPLEAIGTARAARTVDVPRGGRLDVALELQKPAGHLFVDPHIAGAEIRIDGNKAGEGVWEGDVAPGQHTIEIAAAGYQPYQRVVLIHDGDRRTESVALERLAARADYRGVYAGLDFALAVSPSPRNYAADACLNGLGPTTCSKSPAIGAASFISVGYSLGYVGFEGAAYFRWDETSVKDSGGGTLDTSFNQFAFGGGAGVRGFTKGSVARGTLGMRLLALHEIFTENYSTTKSSLLKGSRKNAEKTAPALAWDLGLELGATPGAKFKVGIVAQVEFLGDQVTEADAPTFYVAKGTSVFVGPTLGMQFGY